MLKKIILYPLFSIIGAYLYLFRTNIILNQYWDDFNTQNISLRFSFEIKDLLTNIHNFFESRLELL